MKQHEDLFKDGHIADTVLAILADSQLRNPEGVPDVPAPVLDHVDQCLECKDKIMDVVLFLGNPEATVLPQKPRQKPLPLVETMHNRYFYQSKIAAVFVACAVMVSAYFFIIKTPTPLNQKQHTKMDGGITTGNNTDLTILSPSPGEVNGQQQSTSATDINTTADELETKSRFTLNPNLENMIGSQVRSGIFEAFSPTNNSVVKKTIHFSWKQELKRPSSLKIVNNRGDVLYTFTLSGQTFDFSEFLETGLYYWKLENENELLYVGKFQYKK